MKHIIVLLITSGIAFGIYQVAMKEQEEARKPKVCDFSIPAQFTIVKDSLTSAYMIKMTNDLKGNEIPAHTYFRDSCTAKNYVINNYSNK